MTFLARPTTAIIPRKCSKLSPRTESTWLVTSHGRSWIISNGSGGTPNVLESCTTTMLLVQTSTRPQIRIINRLRTRAAPRKTARAGSSRSGLQTNFWILLLCSVEQCTQRNIMQGLTMRSNMSKATPCSTSHGHKASAMPNYASDLGINQTGQAHATHIHREWFPRTSQST